MTSDVFIYGPAFSTFVRSAAIVCEEKGISYHLGRALNDQTVEKGSPQHLAMHPFGKVPVLLHGDRTLVETATIGRYLDATFGPETLQGRTAWDKAECDEWCALISIYVDQDLVRQYMLELAFPSGANGAPRLDLVEAARENAERALSVVSNRLGDSPYLLGNTFTLADALLAPMLAYNSDSPAAYNLVNEFENLVGYTHRLKARPSGQRVLKSFGETAQSA